MKLSLEDAKRIMEQDGGSLYLSWTQITALPDGLTVGGWLDLSGTQITALPDGLTVGGDLDLSGTQITALPDGLTVGGWLDLSGTQITALPAMFTFHTLQQDRSQLTGSLATAILGVYPHSRTAGVRIAHQHLLCAHRHWVLGFLSKRLSKGELSRGHLSEKNVTKSKILSICINSFSALLHRI